MNNGRLYKVDFSERRAVWREYDSVKAWLALRSRMNIKSIQAGYLDVHVVRGD